MTPKPMTVFPSLQTVTDSLAEPRSGPPLCFTISAHQRLSAVSLLKPQRQPFGALHQAPAVSSIVSPFLKKSFLAVDGYNSSYPVNGCGK